MTQTPSFHRSRDLDKSNKFGQMQLFEIKLCSIFRIEYKAIEFSTNKKNQQLHSRSQYWNDNEAAPANGGFVNKANIVLPTSSTTQLYGVCFVYSHVAYS